MKISLIILISLLFFNCESKKTQKLQIDTTISKIDTSFNQTTKETLITDSLCIECQQKDTITPMGVKIQYKFINGVFKIICSNNSFTREFDSSYTCNKNQNGVWDFVPKFEHETKNYLVFNNVLSTSSGGNPAPLENIAIVVPKSSSGLIQEYPLLEYIKNDYLVYLDLDFRSIHIINLETNKAQNIILKNKLIIIRTPGFAIKELEIANKKLIINYTSLNKNDNEIEIKEVIDLKI